MHDIWNLELFYKSTQDPLIKQDIQDYQDWVQQFKKQYQGKIATLSPAQWSTLLQSMEEPIGKMRKCAYYAYFLGNLNVEDEDAKQLEAFMHQKEMESEEEMIFFDQEMKELSTDQLQNLINHPELKEYKNYFQQFAINKQHMLSEKEEKLLNKLSLIGTQKLNNMHEQVMSKLRIGKDNMSMEQALTLFHNPDRDIRKQASDDVSAALEDVQFLCCDIYNNMLTDKYIFTDIRGYDSWIASRNKSNQISDASVQSLIDAVTGNYDMVHKYYQTKTQLLGIDKAYDYDRYAPLPFSHTKEYSYETAKQLVDECFRDFDSEFADISQSLFDQNHIDSEAILNKRGGAFCAYPNNTMDPFVFLNYQETFRDVSTLIHELGHAIHGKLAQKQNIHVFDTPLTICETASIFSEVLLFEKLYKSAESNEEKITLLGNKIDEMFSTIFRQVSMNRFENSIHTHRKQQGELTGKQFNEYWMKSQKDMFGDSLEIREECSTYWSYIPHFLHTPGYVYAYAFGALLSLSLVAKYKEGLPGFQEKLKELLSSGGSKTPDQLLKDTFDIDLNDPQFWESGLQLLGGYVDEYISIAASLKK